MALSTLAAVKSGLRPVNNYMKGSSGLTQNWTNWATRLFQAGNPDTWTAPTPGVAGQVMTGPVTGFLNVPNPASGETKLARAAIRNLTSSCSGHMLADLLWINSGLSVTLTSAQTVNSVTLPARSIDATTNGDGVLAALLITASTGAGAPTITISYTNQAGTAGKTSTNMVATISSMVTGSLIPLGLAAGDTGIRSIQSLTLSATMTSGSIALILYRPIAHIAAANVTNNADAEVVEDILTLSSAPIFDSHCLFHAFRYNSNGNPSETANFTFSQG